ncbi:2,3-bisphosphoglycerate-independent phosphoglycerate mutase, partial [Acidobacteria bacterium AH-259-O06]|nr:2,3-bisphosphoglycerate-independent phosphoglycerate mutase [Acidobacteria bacterium AH-259-O06]
MSPRRYKCLLVIQDGVGDRPVEAFGDKTPLEAASTPHMDSLIKLGVAGLIDIIGPGVKVGTDIGHLALFDQDIQKDFYRRGPMEAAGVGIFLNPGEVALRCNFATVSEDFHIVDRRAGRIRAEAKELAKALDQIHIDDDVEVIFRQATEHRAVLVLRGEGLSDQISDSDPGGSASDQRVLKVYPQMNDPDAERTAQLVNKFIEQSHQVLKKHPLNIRREGEGKVPANFILTRGAGSLREYIQLPEKRGLRVACVSGERTVLGIARLSGVKAIVTDEMTGNLDTNLTEKAARTMEALGDHDLVYLHLKGCDVAGHDRQPELKRWFIEQTDMMIGEIIKEAEKWKQLYFAFAGDHSTPCELGEHSGDPVPVFLAGGDVQVDDVKTYGECTCAQGGLGRIRCQDFLATIFHYLGA